jgi:hypothetical protein
LKSYLKKPFTKIGLLEWLKVKALSSSSSSTKKKKESQWWPIFKAFNPSHVCISLWMLGKGQPIRELKLGGVNHDRVREWVMCQKAHIT